MSDETSRATWTIAPGEEARIDTVGPDGPLTAHISSEGFLPFRVRTQALGHHVPSMPGSAVLLGEHAFEVVEEILGDDHVLYRLEAWPDEEIFRSRIVYDRELVDSVLHHRRSLEAREKVRPYAWMLHPFVGIFPEEEQTRRADRLGLDPVVTTVAAAATEIVLALVILWLVADRSEATASVFLPILALVLGVIIVFPAGMRIVAAILFAEVSGSSIVELACGLQGSLDDNREAVVPAQVPLSRSGFWARLRLPDRHTRLDDGSILAEGQLPHLSWIDLRRVGVGDDWWSVTPEAPRLERGRLVYAYRLSPIIDPTLGVELEAPTADAYVREVRGQLERHWDEMLAMGGGMIVSLLPAEVQSQATQHREGLSSLRRASFKSALATIGIGIFVAVDATPLVVAVGGLLILDGAWRCLRLQRRRPVGSLLFGWLSPWISPDRDAYHAHRAFERRALNEIMLAQEAN